MKILDRYLLVELAAPFAFGVAAFTGILLASTVLFHLVSEMVREGLPLWLVVQVLALRVPELAFYTFPMSMLLAALMAFGRLSNDQEITAFKAAGVSLYRLMVPVMGLAVAVSLLTIALNETVVPRAALAAKALLYAATHQRQLPLERDHLQYSEFDHGELRRSFYAAHFDGTRMRDVVVQEFERNRLVRLVQAQEASPSQDGWDFGHGTLYQVDAAGDFRYVAHFERQRVVLGAALLALAREDRQAVEMSLGELGAHLARLEATGAGGRELNELRVMWHQKLAVPFACVVFALVGAPMGLAPQRGSSAIGLGLSILVIFVYYVLMFISMALGQTGALSAVVAAWAPNVVAGGLGAWQLRRLARY